MMFCDDYILKHNFYITSDSSGVSRNVFLKLSVCFHNKMDKIWKMLQLGTFFLTNNIWYVCDSVGLNVQLQCTM